MPGTEGRIWRAALERSAQARRDGSLVPLVTSLIKPDGWEPFQLRQLCSATPKHLLEPGPRANPFLPWETSLEVQRLGDSHLLLLNKYPVQPGHLLLITQSWAPQAGWLDASDWSSMVAVAADTSGLWFFNSCAEAGASQPHRHLQLLPRHRGEPACPLEPALRAQLEARAQPWPWPYRLSRRRPHEDQHALAAHYHRQASALGLGDPRTSDRPLHPYNLLISDDWFLMIRRRRERVAGFSVNALGFAGYLLLTRRAELSWLRQHGPWALLEEVAATVP
ncbi:ATP adenylyltransferase [Synechococcus sp. CS-1325]|uniref:ATP adenylyltransferase n=1 Tax=unclassified Synechococcus TaxID=2626047 RepID=UPI000DB02B85|nr:MULTISPECIES: ATP adenylyltransferase [unclassified Synechococcus]MCT0199358.1 ATP adenylyltransferase [Synechococcus sp. CS-1325]MCT0231819.1 ATP adenylyltransferase [Synechococcus sp. CS-1324]PZV02978.1 MAG: ATP adenylyltransferase [Cyanobium sp.]PZV05814.1 MAG: ATP adenylyltransferase [Cyanobium sp.]